MPRPSGSGSSRTAARYALTDLETRGDAERARGGRPGIPDTWRPAAAVPGDVGVPASPATARTDDSPSAATPPGQDEPEASPAASDRKPSQDEHQDVGQPASLPAADRPACQETTAATEPGRGGTAEPAAADGDDSQPADDGDDSQPADDGDVGEPADDGDTGAPTAGNASAARTDDEAGGTGGEPLAGAA